MKLLSHSLFIFLFLTSLESFAQPFGVVVSEGKEGFLKTSCQQPGSFNKFLDSEIETWESYSLFGGEITAIVRDPINAEIAYAGSRDAGVFKTVDGGNSWISAREGLTFFPIRCLTIDHSNTDIIYAGTDFDGIWKTSNAGLTWSRTNYPGEFVVFNIIIDPFNSSILYVGEAGGIGLGVGHVYKSIDAGINWELQETGLPKSGDEYLNGIFSLVINPSDPMVLYAGTNYEGIYKTLNGGDTWFEFNDSVPTTYGSDDYLETINALSISALHPEHPVALLSGKYYKYNGSYWQQINDEYTYIGETIFPGQLLYHPSDSAILFTSSHYTTDAGETWTEYRDSITNQRKGFNCITRQLTGYNTMIGGVAGNNGVASSQNSGQTWNDASDGIVAEIVYSVAIDPEDTQYVYAGTNEFFEYSWDGGESWDKAYYVYHPGGSYYDTITSIGEVSDIQIDPNNPEIIYIAALDFYRSEDRGKTLIKLDSAGSPAFVKKVDHENSNTLYIAGYGVEKSYDKGETWIEISNDLPEIFDDLIHAKSFALDLVDTNILWLGTWWNGGIFKTVNGGENWQSMGLTDKSQVSAIAVHPQNNNIIFAGIDHFGGEILKSTDGGLSWELKKNEISPPKEFVFDPRNPDQIYTATEGYGVFRSNDCGETWYPYDNGIFYPVQYSIDISKTDPPELVTGTYGSGLYHIQPGLCNAVNITSQPGNLSICSGASASLTVIAEGDDLNYQWFMNESIEVGTNSFSIEFSAVTKADEGNYFCRISNNCGVVISTVVELQVTEVDVSVEQLSGTLEASKLCESYQWIDCEMESTIEGAVDYQFSPENSGDYSVILAQNGCVDTSACYTITIAEGTAVTNTLSSGWCIYPNPTPGELMVFVSEELSSKDGTQYQLTSTSGGILLSGKLSADENSFIIDLNSFPAGIYLLKLMDEKQIQTIPILRE